MKILVNICIGYGGGSMRFDMAMAPDFAEKMKQANEKVYGNMQTYGEGYESLEGTISRMRRVKF